MVPDFSVNSLVELTIAALGMVYSYSFMSLSSLSKVPLLLCFQGALKMSQNPDSANRL